ncbi:MAG: 30S ribosomal protein S6 [Lachnospiraceae bacterium]|nr:30S ribosomal protein S6 [Lachnospiraceae bacterium]MBQ6196968.1 30S ribosomal protein S6 [Lachnospiraceae bacterium]
MSKYELAVVLSAALEDEARSAALDRVKDYVEKAGGNITNVDDWGKKKLAYDIQKMSEAYYYFIQFEAETDAPGEIESNVRLMESVIRFLCIKKDEA